MGLNLIKFKYNLKHFNKIILIQINLIKIIKRKLLVKIKLINLPGSRINWNKLIRENTLGGEILNQALR
jgi:hypothetical protein